jgi:hypothetical protein
MRDRKEAGETMNATASAAKVDTSRARKATHHGIRAWATAHCSLENIAELRQKLGPPGGTPFPAAFLKPSDEQTVVAVAAVLQAISQHGLDRVNFGDWGVIAAPRFLGRLAASDTIHKFEAGGPWKAPPLFVPHRSLHAISGTISQTLQIKGPNFGVGGGVSAPVEGLLTALTLLDEQHLPGLWLVVTQCDPEPQPDYTRGVNTVPVVCHALALAFTPVAEDWHGLRLSLIEASAEQTGRANPLNQFPERIATFPSLARFIEQGTAARRFGTWSCPLKWGCELRLSDEA